MTIGSEFATGFFDSTTAQEVGVRLGEMLGDQPFVVFSRATPTQGSNVRRLVGGEAAVTYRPEAIRSCLILHTDEGDVELGFDSSGRNHTKTYRFTTESNLVFERIGRPEDVTVVMPLGAARTPHATVFVPNREYGLHAGNVDQVAPRLAERLTGRIVAYAHADISRGLEGYRFPMITGVWIGRGYDNRLIFEVENDGEIPELDDHVFLLGSKNQPNALGERANVMFCGNRSIRIRLQPKSAYRTTHLYWALP